MALPEELEFEVEALRATYDDVIVQATPGPQHAPAGTAAAASAAAAVAVPVAPRTHTTDPARSYVAARLVLHVPLEYPALPPGVQLADAKGLGDARLAALQSRLAVEAAELAGELSLGHLVETAIDLLTEGNQPEGMCAFCLEPLLPAEGSGPGGAAGDAERGPPSLLRLDCYHCYHTACFAPWFQWQQQQLAAREAQLWDQYKSMAPTKLEEEGIRREAAPGPLHSAPDGGGPASATGGEGGSSSSVECAQEGGEGCSERQEQAYVLACPACRAEVAPASLAHAWRQLQASTIESWSGGGAGGSRSSRAALQALPAWQQQAVAAMQRRHAAIRARQAARGGLVEASHSVSVSDLQQAAAVAAAAAAAQPGAGPAGGAGAEQEPAPGLSGRGISGRGGRGGRPGDASGRGRGRGRGRRTGAAPPPGGGESVVPAAAAAVLQGSVARLDVNDGSHSHSHRPQPYSRHTQHQHAHRGQQQQQHEPRLPPQRQQQHGPQQQQQQPGVPPAPPPQQGHGPQRQQQQGLQQQQGPRANCEQRGGGRRGRSGRVGAARGRAGGRAGESGGHASGSISAAGSGREGSSGQ